MASSKLQLLMLLLGLTDGASGGVPGAGPALTTKRKPLDPSFLRVSPSKFTVVYVEETTLMTATPLF